MPIYRFTPRADSIVKVDATLKQGSHVLVIPMIFDTGASYTIISSHSALLLGFDLGKISTILPVVTANREPTSYPLITIESMSILGLVKENVKALVISEFPAQRLGADGLLGMSYLEAFRIYFSPREGILELNSID